MTQVVSQMKNERKQSNVTPRMLELQSAAVEKGRVLSSTLWNIGYTHNNSKEKKPTSVNIWHNFLLASCTPQSHPVCFLWGSRGSLDAS
jgi:hypothetical protein